MAQPRSGEMFIVEDTHLWVFVLGEKRSPFWLPKRRIQFRVQVVAVGLEAQSGVKAALAEHVGTSAETVIEFFYFGGATRNIILLLTAGLIASSLVVWRLSGERDPLKEDENNS